MLNIFITSKDIEYSRKVWGYLAVYKGYLPVYHKGYGIFGTPYTSPDTSLTAGSRCHILGQHNLSAA